MLAKTAQVLLLMPVFSAPINGIYQVIIAILAHLHVRPAAVIHIVKLAGQESI